MDNLNYSILEQLNANYSDHSSPAVATSDSGGGSVVGGLIAADLLNTSTSTAAGVNLAPITQANLGSDLDGIVDGDIFADIL